MKHTLMKTIAVLTAVMMTVLGVTACDFTIGGGNADGVAIDFAGEKVSLEEAKLYIYTMQYETEVENEYYVGYLFGGYEDFWAYENGGATYGEQCKTDAVNSLLQVKALVREAKKTGVTLTAEEEKKVTDAIATFKEKEATVLAASGASDELLTKYITENAIANKMYLSLIADVDTEMDAAEMLRKRVEGLSIGAKTSYMEGDESVEYSDEDKKENVAAVYLQVEDMLSSGKTPAEVEEAFADDTTVNVTAISEFAVGADAAEEGSGYTSYRGLAWSLDEDEYGAAIIGDSNAYVLHCISADDAEYRAQAEEAELNERKGELFAEKFAAVSDKYLKYHVYEEAFTDITVSEAMYDSEFVKQMQAEALLPDEDAEEDTEEE